MTTENVREIVKEKYGAAARRVSAGEVNGCCGASACCDLSVDPITSGLYDEAQKSGLPQEAVLASLGCGNPTALAALKPGEVVLDLGSGGGIDVLLSAKRVGPTGKAYGLDMTDDMLALAHANMKKAGVENVEFLKGEIENIPLPDNTVDVIISNCVINLSGDKDRVLGEAFRVLKPGGRFAVSDVVTRGDVPEEVRQHMLLWVGCIAGALSDSDYAVKLAKAGFAQIEIEPTRVYDIEDARTFLSAEGIDVDAMAPQVEGKFMSAFVRAGETAGGRVLRSGLLRMNLSRRLIAEALGTALLLAAVVGSGIMGERLAGGNVGIALMANSIATGATLIALIYILGPVSGAHFNPAVTISVAWRGGGLSWSEVPGYVTAQLVGAIAGVGCAHLMFGERLIEVSRHIRSGGGQMFSEFVATFGLLAVVWGCGPARAQFAVGLYIVGAYWFTASTSFANPAVTVARAFTDTFAGIRPQDAPAFIAAQLTGALAATLLFRWLIPTRSTP